MSSSPEQDRHDRFACFERVLQRVFDQAHAHDFEQRAQTVLVGIAKELAQSADALDQAAYWLKESGGLDKASTTKQAAIRAREQAKGLVGE